MGIYTAERRKTAGFENRPFPLQTKRIALQGGKEKREIGDDGESIYMRVEESCQLRHFQSSSSKEFKHIFNLSLSRNPTTVNGHFS